MSLKSRTRRSYIHFQTYRTRWSDNDQYGHLNNSIYNHLIDSVVNDYLITHCGLQQSTNNSIGLVVSSHCEYFSSLAFPEVLELGLCVRKLGRSSVKYEVGFFRHGGDEDEEVKAVGGFVHVFVEREGRRPVQELEDGLKKGLERILVVEEARL
ncbi:thioesterase family protein [Wilcoxina mikolae CBS 423.85]|nr:thioesterase family protein [Wilcoxina mikolae CBS 423.85]